MKHLSVLVACIALLTSCHLRDDVLIVAHRGARLDNPENTISGFRSAMKDGAKMLEMDLQITQDNIVVLYHPLDLKANTSCNGDIANTKYRDLERCKIHGKNDEILYIPTLKDVLVQIPDTTFILDIKSKKFKQLIDSTALLLSVEKSWHRVIFYSTDPDHIKFLKQKYPDAAYFEDRNSTRKILMDIKLNNSCPDTNISDYFAFELRKDKLYIVEKLTLGNYETEMKNVQLFDQSTVECIRSINKNTKIFLFGINTKEDYKYAKNIGVNGVVTDSVRAILEKNR